MKSDRDIQLVGDIDIIYNMYGNISVLVVEEWNKWYSPYLILSKENIKRADEFDSWNDVSFYDDSWDPLEVLNWCKNHNYYVGITSYIMMCYMWFENTSYGKNSVTRQKYIEPKDISMIVVDFEDINNQVNMIAYYLDNEDIINILDEFLSLYHRILRMIIDNKNKEDK